jgi:hypothetical protein
VDLCRMNNVIIIFPEQRFPTERDGNVSWHHFAYDNYIRSISTGVLGPADNSTKTDIDSMQIATKALTNRATAVVCFLLGNCPAFGVYMPTFRNTLFHLHRHPPHIYLLWRWNRQCVPKRRRRNSRRRGITLKKAYNIQNTAKAWNQEGQLLITPDTIYEAERSVNSMWFHVASPRKIECPFGEWASGDNDNCVIYDPELVIRCRMNECCSSPLKHTAVCETAGLAKLVDTQPAVERLRHRCLLLVILAFCQ